jgi:hypothetical protein
VSAARAAAFHSGAIAPESAGRNSTPSAPVGVASASASTAAASAMRQTSHSHAIAPPASQPGFSTNQPPPG